MTHPDWQSLRAHTIDRFDGETPHPQTEQEIIDAYQLHPDAVERAIAQVAADLNAGNIRSGWGILRHRAEAILNPPSNPTAKTGRDLEKRLARAEQWIRNAGKHYDRWDDVAEDLDAFDVDTASLKPLWIELRPEAEAIEHQARERAQEWIAAQRRLKDARKAKLAELDAAQQRQPVTTTAGDFA